MSEKGEAARDGATLVHNSGRSKGTAKGDATLGRFLLDYKEYARSFGVSIDNWSKLSTDAWKNNQRTPAFKLVLGSGKEMVRLFVVDEATFHEMNEAWKEKYEQV